MLKKKVKYIEYARTFYNGGGGVRLGLKECAESYLSHLPKDVTHLLTMGSSGVAIASAMMALSKIELFHVTVRKSYDESGHQRGYAGVVDASKVYAIVDDFSSSGFTVSKLLDWANNQGLKVPYAIMGHNAHPGLMDRVKVILVETQSKW